MTQLDFHRLKDNYLYILLSHNILSLLSAVDTQEICTFSINKRKKVKLRRPSY